MQPKQLRSLNEAVRKVQLNEFRLKNGEPDMSGDSNKSIPEVAKQYGYNHDTRELGMNLEDGDEVYTRKDNKGEHHIVHSTQNDTWCHVNSQDIDHYKNGKDSDSLEDHLENYHK